jgi:hypothetical protein
MKTAISCIPLAASLVAAQAPAYDVSDSLAVNAVLAGALQCQRVSGTDADDACRGAMPFQPSVRFHPTDTDEFFVKLGWASGNGLNRDSPFIIRPWAADLQDDVTNINGRKRDHLLNAWYSHAFRLGEDRGLRASLGIIDATDYLDHNAYSNNEYTQFMNAALVNAPNVFLPSYDAGAALEWASGPWSVSGVWMNVGENEEGNNYNFYGVQLGYAVDTSMGEGHYRVLVDSTSKDFAEPDGLREERRLALIASCDQQFGDVFGGFLRFGWQDAFAAVDYDALYSGGINIIGSPWGRAADNIGLGLAYLNGGNAEVARSWVAEAYYRYVAGEHLALTADLQYMKDDYRDPAQDSPRGFIFALRATAGF